MSSVARVKCYRLGIVQTVESLCLIGSFAVVSLSGECCAVVAHILEVKLVEGEVVAVCKRPLFGLLVVFCGVESVLALKIDLGYRIRINFYELVVLDDL